MQKNNTTIWNSPLTQQLAEVLVAIDNDQTMQNFLRDVMTKKEITEIAARFEAARMLASGEKYTTIITKTKLSSRTVARISDWLQNGRGGYPVALQIINARHAHIPPVRAE